LVAVIFVATPTGLFGGGGAVRLRGTPGPDDEPAGALWRADVRPLASVGVAGFDWKMWAGSAAHRCLGTE
jgi:hypothetical protein